MNRQRTAPILILAMGILAVSTASVFIRYAQNEAPSLTIAAYRLALATLFLAPLAFARTRTEWLRLSVADRRWLIASGLFLALHFATWITSLRYTTVASSVVLVGTSPLWVALAGRFFLRERLGGAVIGGLLLAIAGGALVAASDAGAQASSAPLAGDALALAGAWMAAGYWLIGRHLRQKLSLIPYVTAVYGTAATVLLAMTLVARQALTGFSPKTYLWFALLALLPQVIGHSSCTWALALLPAVFVAVATLGEPVGSSILALALLGETPTPLKIAGGALILAGIALCFYSRRK